MKQAFRYKIIIAFEIAFILMLTLQLKTSEKQNRTIKLKTISTRSENIFEKLNTQTKYIQYECKTRCGGWSDRLDGIMSALAFALFQNRNFLITITQPCLINNLLESNLIKWDAKKTQNSSKVYELNSVDDFKMISRLKTLDLITYLNEYDLITIRNNQNWLKSFSINPTISHSINQLGYNQSEFRTHFLMREWYAALFKLKPSLTKRYQEFLKLAKPNSETKLICAQIRLGGSNRKNHATDWKFNERNVTKLVWEFIRKNFLPKLSPNNKENYKIFVTTDDEDVEKEALEQFGSSQLVINSGDIIHIDRDVRNLNDCSKIEKTILDFHCLQNCDMAVISKSGFGKLGLWNRKYPIQDLYLLSAKEILKFNQSEFFYNT
jgi:hypothetical protein